jgi:F-type H+-transporting ATPase subunit delta
VSTAAPDVEAYAEALMHLGRAAECLREVETALPAVVDLLDTETGVKRFLHDPAVRDAGKREALERLVPAAPSLLLDFLGILVDNRRLPALPAIAAAFYDKVSGRRGQSAGELVSAVPLKPETVAAAAAAASALLGRRISLQARVDPDLIGGAVIRVGHVVLDHSVARRIEDMRAYLLREHGIEASPEAGTQPAAD